MIAFLRDYGCGVVIVAILALMLVAYHTVA